MMYMCSLLLKSSHAEAKNKGKFRGTLCTATIKSYNNTLCYHMDAAYGYVSKSRCFKFQLSLILRHLHLLFHFFLFHFFSSPSGNPRASRWEQLVHASQEVVDQLLPRFSGPPWPFLWQLFPFIHRWSWLCPPFFGQSAATRYDERDASTERLSRRRFDQRSDVSAVLQLCWRELKKITSLMILVHIKTASVLATLHFFRLMTMMPQYSTSQTPVFRMVFNGFLMSP